MIISPNFTPTANVVYDASIKTIANWTTLKQKMFSLTVPKDLTKRRVWFLIDEETGGAGALDVAGSIVFYLGGSEVTRLPFIQAGAINAFGWNPFIAGGPTEVVSFRFATGNVTSANPFTLNVTCDKIQAEMDTLTYTGTNIGAALMVASEYPQV